MATLADPGVRRLFTEPNFAVVSTLRNDGTIQSSVVWADIEDEQLVLNSAMGRGWPANLERHPELTVLAYNRENPYEYVEVRGTAKGTTDGAKEHIDRLATKYLGVEEYPMHIEGEQRVTYVVEPATVIHRGG